MFSGAGLALLAGLAGQPSLTARAAPPQDQVTIQVNGSPLGSITTSPSALTPGFAQSTTDYIVRCQAGINTLTLTLSAVPGGTIQVGSQQGSTVNVSETVLENQAVVVDATDPHNPSGRISYWVRCLPHDFPRMNVSRPGSPPAGWYLTGNITPSQSAGSSDYVMVLDSNGVPVWYRKSTIGAGNVELLPQNTLSWAPSVPVGIDPRLGFFLYQLDTQDLSTFKAPDGPTDFHELLQDPSGNRWLFGTPVKQNVDLSPLGAQFAGANNTIVDCLLEEVSPSGAVIWEWRASDHVKITETQPDLAVIIQVGGQKAADLFHCNSIDLDPQNLSTGNVLVSLRNTSAVYLLNRASKKVIWKLGGNAETKDSEQVLTIANDPESFISGQHDARFQPGGAISLYDDHTGASSGVARGLEYAIDASAGTATMDWEYPSPTGERAAATGGFRRYAGGNDNIVTWGFTAQSGFTEVDASGNVLFAVTFPDGEKEYRTVKVATSALDINQLRATAGLPRPSCTVPTVGGTGAGSSATSTRFYFAEGYTGKGFWECLALLMPGASGTATVDYWTPAGHMTGTVNLTAGKVAWVNVNRVVGPGQPVSIQVTLPAPGIVERELYFDNGTWKGATDLVGVNSPSTEWNLAEGSTLSGFSEYLVLFNPGSTPTVANLNYATDSGAHPVKTLTVPAGSRVTVEVFKGDTTSNVNPCTPSGQGADCGVGPSVGGVSVQVRSGGQGLVVERPIYVNGLNFGSGPIRDGHDAFGARAAGTAWNFAEGTTLSDFYEYLTIQNPGSALAHVGIKYLDQSGSSRTRTLSLGGHRRATIEVFRGTGAAAVSDCVPNGAGASCGVGRGLGGVSAQVTSDQPIVAERPMYMVHDFGTGPVSGAHDIVGGPLSTLFGFSALSTAPGDFDYLTVLNPGNSSASLSLNYYTSSGPVTRTVTLAPHSRHTVEVFNGSEGPGASTDPIGVVVSSSSPVLVEKPTYSTNTIGYGGTDTTGYSPASF
jgi:hypothetical protein